MQLCKCIFILIEYHDLRKSNLISYANSYSQSIATSYIKSELVFQRYKSLRKGLSGRRDVNWPFGAFLALYKPIYYSVS